MMSPGAGPLTGGRPWGKGEGCLCLGTMLGLCPAPGTGEDEMTTSGGTRGRAAEAVYTDLAPEVGTTLGEGGMNSRGGWVVFLGAHVRSEMRHDEIKWVAVLT